MKGPGGAQKATKDDPLPEVMELAASLNVLSRQLEKEIKAGSVEVSLQPRGLVVSLKQAAFFPSGTDVLDPAAYPVLEKLADALKPISNPVRVEGHTDAIPIHSARFRSNWELSAARSIAMMEALTNQFDIQRDRMAIVGYADTVPIASNDTAEGRARNRRVDLVILNNYTFAKTEAPPAKQN